MYNNITQLIENQGGDGTPCEKVLGSGPRVAQIARVWAKNAQLFHLMGVHGMIDYQEKNSFTREECDAFKAGLAFVPSFMEKCLQEWLQQQEKSKEDTKV